MLVNNFLEQSAKIMPEKVALIVKGVRYTYREIDEMANKLANALISEGFEKGDRVAIFLDNSLEAVVSIFSVLKAGGVFLMVNPTTKPEKLAYILNNSRASTLISSSDKIKVIVEASQKDSFLELVFLAKHFDSSLRNRLDKKTFSLIDILKGNRCPQPALHTIDADLAMVIYTSGSTGVPKGVMMTHLSIVSAADSITSYLENKTDDIILNTLPLSFDYGLYQVLMGFKMGATVILEKTFLYPSKIIDIILKEKVTGFPIVPTISAILLQMEDMLRKYSFDHLRYITNTGAALPVTHIRRMRRIFPETRIYSMYGLTECKRVSYLPPDQIDIRPTSVGKAIPNTEAYIIDEHGKRAGAGVIGELVVRGPNVMKGYWEDPEETAKKIKHGESQSEKCLYTGDLFKMDEEGYLYFVARKDDIIKSRGEKVSPKEIEEALCQIAGVDEAAVVGVPDPILGQSIKAFVVRNGSGITKEDILRYCSKHLEDFFIPQEVEFVTQLPKTENGKINKEALV